MMIGPDLDAWEGRPVTEWRQRWRLPELHILASTGSTNDVARALAERGAAPGTVVMAEHQTAGRGRHGRSWYDAPGMSILFSILVRPAPAADAAPGTAPLRIGVAVATALRDCTGVEAGLKWPNDVVCRDRKLAGILCEAGTAGHSGWLVAGIGINVRSSPDVSREVATSLDAECAHTPSRGDVMSAVLDALHPLFERPLTPLTVPELNAYGRLDTLEGRAVRLEGDARFESGIARGIAPDGALLVEVDGTIARITSATVRLQRNETPASRRS